MQLLLSGLHEPKKTWGLIVYYNYFLINGVFFFWMTANQWAVWFSDITVFVFSTVKGMVGQTEWSEYFPDCGGTSQSPVDVVTTQTKYDPSLIPLTPLGYDQHGNKPFTLSNNGHTGNYGGGRISGSWYESFFKFMTVPSSSVTWQQTVLLNNTG